MVTQILSPAQRTMLFDPPSDPATIERLYTLGPEDLVEVFRRRRAANRLGYAVQLGYLRHPGRALEPGEMPPAAMLTVLATQTGCEPDAFADYAARDTTLREHRAAIERRLGLRAFERADRAMAFATASEVATSTDRCDAIVAAMVERLRGAGVVLPVPALLERIALVARAEARRQAFARLGRDLTADQVERLDALLRIGGTPTRSSLAWIRDWPEAPGAGNLKAIVERLDHVRNIGIEAERARRIHASRYAVIAREAAIMTAQHLTRLENRRRLATLVAFAIEMEVALTDAAILMVEKLVGGMFRRADRTRSERLIDQARLFRDTARLHIRLGRTLLDARSTGSNALALVDERIGWAALEQSVRAAEELTRPGEDGLDEVVERYPAVRRFLPTFVAAFRFQTARAGDPLLGAVELLRSFYAEGRTILPRKAPVSFLKPKWRRVVLSSDGVFNRRGWEIAVLVHLRDRLASGAIWVDGSRAYRTLDDYLLPAPAFATMRAEGRFGLAVSGSAVDWIAAHRDRLRQRMDEVERAATEGTLPDAGIENGRLTISPLRRSTPDEAEELKARLYGLLPRIRITDLLAEVAVWTGFADRFVHARTGMAASDQPALMGAILADGTNLGLARMAESSRGLTHARLLWTAEWHIRDETYSGALAAIVDHHHAHPLSRLWGPGDTSSSDGQFFRAGGRGEARADHNARTAASRAYCSTPMSPTASRPSTARSSPPMPARPLTSSTGCSTMKAAS